MTKSINLTDVLPGNFGVLLKSKPATYKIRRRK